MPFSIRPGITVQPVDALFSATSAVCVTGLLTVDTADTFTPVGQAVMAVLIQIGGLGITSIGMGLALAAGRRISLRERTLIREAMNVGSLEGMVRLGAVAVTGPWQQLAQLLHYGQKPWLNSDY